MEYTNYNPAPWFKDPKLRLFGIGAVVIFLVVVLVVVFVGRSRSGSRAAAVLEFERAQVAEGQIATGVDVCDGSEDPEMCREAVVMRVATGSGAVTVCDQLADVDRANCIFEIAYDRLDHTVCETGECRNQIRLASARAQKDYGACGEITDKDLKVVCEAQTAPYALAQGGCEDGTLPNDLCNEANLQKEAVLTGDLSICDRILEGADECVLAVKESDQDQDRLSFEDETALGLDPFNPDSDGDQLNDGDEIDLGTDPFDADSDDDGLNDGQEIGASSNPLNPDTDGDGFLDGEEASNGFSPVGPGREGDL